MPRVSVSDPHERWCVSYGPHQNAVIFNAHGITVQADKSPEYFVYVSQSGALVSMSAGQHFLTQEAAKAVLVKALRDHATQLHNCATERFAAANNLEEAPLLVRDDLPPVESTVDPANKPN